VDSIDKIEIAGELPAVRTLNHSEAAAATITTLVSTHLSIRSEWDRVDGGAAASELFSHQAS
jgi:hypothetical protein